MNHVERLLGRRTGAAAKDQCVRFRNVLALDEHFVERRMARVGGLRRQDDFAIARQRDSPDAIRMIGQRDATNLDIIVRCDGDLHRQTNAVIVAPKLCHVGIELHSLAFGRGGSRLIGG